jgi:hypothetical protein
MKLKNYIDESKECILQWEQWGDNNNGSIR